MQSVYAISVDLSIVSFTILFDYISCLCVVYICFVNVVNLRGTLVKKKGKKYTSQNIRCNILVIG
jgi:hypothetical protein